MVLHGVLFFSALYHSVVMYHYTYAVVPDFNFLGGRYYLWYLIRSVLYCACLISGGLLLINKSNVVFRIYLVGVSLVFAEMLLTLYHGTYIGE